MMSVLPLLAGAGMAFGALLGKLSSESSEAYGRANSIVQQVHASSSGWCHLWAFYRLLLSPAWHNDAHRMQALSNIRTVMAFNGQEVTKAKYRDALALPQTYTIRQGFVSGLVMGTIYGELRLLYCKLACCGL